MSQWKPDWILKLVTFWITYLLVFSWLPLIRILFDGESYAWGTSHFGLTFRAAGWQPDAWLLVFKCMVMMTLLFLGLRGAGRAFQWLLAAWSLALAVDIIMLFVLDPRGFEFHGDTLGVHLNLGWTVLGVVLFFSILALYWVFGRSNSEAASTPPVWSARNRLLITVFFLMLPIQFVLLRFGEPHGTTDAIGVLLTIAQCPLLALALYPWSEDRS